MDKTATSLAFFANYSQSFSSLKLDLHVDDEPEIIRGVRVCADCIFLYMKFWISGRFIQDCRLYLIGKRKVCGQSFERVHSVVKGYHNCSKSFHRIVAYLQK